MIDDEIARLERLHGGPISCPVCGSGPGRQNPQYAHRAATGWFCCEVCRSLYVASHGQLWRPLTGLRVTFRDRSQDCTGEITGIRGELLDIREVLGPDRLSATVFTRYATVCTPVKEVSDGSKCQFDQEGHEPGAAP